MDASDEDPAVVGVPPETRENVRPSATGLVTAPVAGETDVVIAEPRLTKEERATLDAGGEAADRTEEAAGHLAAYLRDHRAGAAGGLSLIKRSAKSNAGTELGRLLDDLFGEISDDCTALEEVMGRLGVKPDPVKMFLAPVAERVSRLKINRHPLRYSALDKVVELELLASAIDAKGNLWRALAVVAEDDGRLDAARIQEFIERSTNQHSRVVDAHQDVVAEAFGGSGDERT